MKVFRHILALFFTVYFCVHISHVSGDETAPVGEVEDETLLQKNTDETIKIDEKNRPATKSRFNKKIDVSGIEKSWESGDDEDELENEYEIRRKVAQKVQKRKNGINLDRPEDIANLVKKDPLSLAGLNSNGASGLMYFVDLKPKQSNGKVWTKKLLDDLAAKWSGMMKSGSLPANVFNIGEQEKEARFLVNCDKGWMVTDSMKFVMQQPETVKISKDNKDYYPKDYGINQDDDDDDDDEL
jgi:hypothetical protein